ncbi:MAG: 4Fe-4S dicluster domain-containing protein [Chloroflexi bacterium]|nr:4Fe-4S dicluster domain-containing protein [Chloroflexota bacterium]MDA8186555.1 4Fe-4S dicluster domain-containing protein [Dehalococcoidales bacterium]
MPRLGMVIDLKRCIGCQACTLACKAEQGTPKGVFYTRVLEKEEGTYPNVKKTFVPVLCNHCQNAPCERVCPTGATSKRPDGVVLVDHNVCIGCRACYAACPYNNRFFLAKGILSQGYFDNGLTPFERMKYGELQEGVVAKCTFCVERVEQGLEPSCVNTCTAGARVFGDLDDADSEVSRLLRQRKGVQLLSECDTDPSVYYLWG